MGYSTTDALARVRRGARINTTDTTYTTAVILDILDAVIRSECVPSILNLQDDYYLRYLDIAITASRKKYPIPTRSSLSRIHSVERLNSAKNESQLLEWRNLRDIDLNSSGDPYCHYILDDSLLVYPTPSVTSGYLRIYYHCIPSTLVATTECMLITGGVSTGVLTGVSLAGWTTGLKYDIVSAESPFALIHCDLTATGVNAGVSITFTLSDLDVNRLSSGTYYVTLAKQTCYPMIPETLHDLVASMAVARIREEIGDEGFAQKYQLNKALLTEVINAIVPRKETETKPNINYNSMYRLF